MTTEINILHVSDLHAKTAEKDKLQARIDALFDDMVRQDFTPHLVMFTGDLAFSGKKEEYDLVHEIFFSPLYKRFHLSPKKVFVIPGNHDVNRELIDTNEESMLKKLAKTSEAAGEAFSTKPYATSRLAPFFEYSKNNFPTACAPFAVTTVDATGFEIGVAALNSAWRCSGSQDQHRLFLTHQQVNASAAALSNCTLRIALIHHPFDWYHDAENEILEDLKRRFEIILSGHLHKPISIGEQTTSHNSLFLTAPALFAGKHMEGYNIYRIRVEDRAVVADFRKYIRVRNEFDRDTTHARDGTHKFDLPVREISKMTRAVMVQRMASCKTRLQQTVKRQLQVIQKVDNPVLVTPKVSKISWTGGTKTKSPLRASVLEIARGDAVVFGPADSGKTILLQTLAADLSDVRATDMEARLAMYVPFKSGMVFDTKAALAEFLDSATSAEFSGEQLHHAVLLADGLGERDLPTFDMILDLAKDRDFHVVFAVGSEFLFDSLAQKPTFQSCSYYEVSHWGPSRIREFVVKYFEHTEINVDAAYEFVRASLEDTDIPASPWIVALYLSIFPTLGRQVSSLSFVRLLEKIEEHRLGQIETSAADSLYNKRHILMRMACACLNQASISMDRKALEEMVLSYFQQKFLNVDATAFIASLVESGLLVLSGDSVKFSYFAFYDYFLARAFERKIVEPESILTSLSGCLSIGQALTLYGGIFRENASIAQTVLSHVGTAFKDSESFTLKDLEKYITDLLLAHDNKQTAEQIADRDLKTKIDYEQYDEEFEHKKTAAAQKRLTQFTPTKPTDLVEELGLRIVALKTFYNLFRNLENISGEEKVKLLDQVLDFHIRCNLSLIQFFHSLHGDATSDFRTVTAYMVTMGGQMFLSTNIGNQSLQDTIIEALNSTTNDLKRLLLECLYGDLRLPGYQKRLEDYVSSTDCLIAVELIYLKTRHLLITHDGLQIPASTISAFQAAFRRRCQLYGDKVSAGAYDKAYSSDFEAVKLQHLKFFNAKEALMRTSNYS